MTRKSTFGALVFALLMVTSGLSGIVAATQTSATPSDASPAPLAQETTTTQGNETVNATASVTLEDQRTNGSVLVVNRTNLSTGGFVVIVAQNGTVLGNTTFLEAGVHRNLTVELDPNISEAQVVIATPHIDTNDNQMFDFNATKAAEIGVQNATDRPVLQPTGIPITDVAFVVVGNQTRRRTTTASKATPDR